MPTDFVTLHLVPRASLVAQMVHNLPAMQEIQVRFLDQKIPWRRKWLPTPVFLLGEFHEQRLLEAYILWVAKSQIRLRD